MASGHLISLPSLRASDENGKRETASPRALHTSRTQHPAPGMELCLPVFLSRRPASAHATHPNTSPVEPLPSTRPGPCHLLRAPEALVLCSPAPSKCISQTLLRALRGVLSHGRGAKVKGEDGTVTALRGHSLDGEVRRAGRSGQTGEHTGQGAGKDAGARGVGGHFVNEGPLQTRLAAGGERAEHARRRGSREEAQRQGSLRWL